LRAICHQRGGQPEEAEACLAAAAELPDDAPWPDPLVDRLGTKAVAKEAQLGEANRLRHQDRTAEALRILEQLVANYPEWAAAWLTLARTLIQQGRFEDAEAPLRRVIRLAPEDPMGHFYLGVS